MTTAVSEPCGTCGHPADEHMEPGGCYHIMAQRVPFFDCQCTTFTQEGS